MDFFLPPQDLPDELMKEIITDIDNVVSMYSTDDIVSMYGKHSSRDSVFFPIRVVTVLSDVLWAVSNPLCELFLPIPTISLNVC